MIITCPECATRYQADAAKFPAGGRKVKCAKCGHAWHQAAPATVADVSEPAPVPAPPPSPPEPPALQTADEPPRAAAFAPPPEQAFDVSAHTAVLPSAGDVQQEPSPWSGRLGIVTGWILLFALVVIAGWLAIRYRQDVVSVWPRSTSLYAAVGRPVNPRGIDFTDVSYKRETQDGQPVLAIAGKLVNTSGRERPVSQIRAALLDDRGREVYHWTFSPGITTMKPGRTAKFLTRISSPPPAARHLEVRFARDGE